MDSQTQMKQVVADAAIKEVKSDMILGLGSGSTAALMIKSLADEMRSGKLQNIRGVATSFQSEVLALELDIPLIDLASVSQIDLAIDGADEVGSRGLGDVYKRQLLLLHQQQLVSFEFVNPKSFSLIVIDY